MISIQHPRDEKEFAVEVKNSLYNRGFPPCESCASLLLSQGVDPNVVSNMLGHSRVSTTLDVYGHLIPSKKQEAGEAMEDLLDSAT